jgi:peptidoglycan/xylan/chitin deacetylase (PgdA/CDA1 family)
VQLTLARNTLAGAIFCRGPEWRERAREAVKRWVPEPVLAARRERAAGAPGGGREWMRQAGARVYVGLRVPALLAPVRGRYQLRPPEGNGAGAIGLTRRTEPSARILYYHRVNEDADPFFPSTPTSVFEREMAYLARRYKVVGLAELLDRLEGGRPEALLAVTFDDGYRDNFENAFPVLQKYGLPATIFLATGSVDSREPLWFERLAGALKRTERAYVELETDIPRRFPTRTQAERLEANARLLQLLRGMSDGERAARLEEILAWLAAPDCGRRGAMLTWDQARRMSAGRIEFGGHTVSHGFLARLAPEQAAWEVAECKRRVERELQAPARFFAYPNGRREDFAEWNKRMLRAAGYRAALTTIWGLNYRSTDPMELRRGGPWEESPAMFACKLDWYQMVNG